MEEQKIYDVLAEEYVLARAAGAKKSIATIAARVATEDKGFISKSFLVEIGDMLVSREAQNRVIKVAAIEASLSTEKDEDIDQPGLFEEE